jgi:hypothetical protein
LNPNVTALAREFDVNSIGPDPQANALGLSQLTPYKNRRHWSDQYEQAVMQTLSPWLIRKGNWEEDVLDGSDFISRAKSIGCRVRSYEAFKQYGHDFTLRAPKELSKVLGSTTGSPNCDWFFYAYAHPQIPTKLAAWLILDMHVFRDELRVNDQIKRQMVSKEGVDQFAAFDLRTFRFKELIVGCSDNMVSKLGEWY